MKLERYVSRSQILSSLAILTTELGSYPEGIGELLTAFKQRNDHDLI